jgi:DNA-binding CsgD family transcriptional regulator
MAADQEFRQRFLRESRAAAAVDDPHIIPVYEAGEADGVLFISMRYVPGGDVKGLLRREGPLPPARAAAERSLGPERTRAAEERGQDMTLATAAELAVLLTGTDTGESRPDLGQLTAGDRDLVALVARGHTDAEIAEQLHLDVRTVRSRVDQIREKAGCPRRADLSRLALQAGLV